MENKRYTIAQAIELLNQGKRITHELWGCSYIYKNSEGVVMAHAGSFREIPAQRYHYSLNELKELYNDDVCFCKRVECSGYNHLYNKPESNRRMEKL